MPRFCQDMVGRRIDIPSYDVPTVGRRPIYKWEDSPQLWLHSPKDKADDYWLWHG